MCRGSISIFTPFAFSFDTHEHIVRLMVSAIAAGLSAESTSHSELTVLYAMAYQPNEQGLEK
jgi:hypothetical protein